MAAHAGASVDSEVDEHAVQHCIPSDQATSRVHGSDDASMTMVAFYVFGRPTTSILWLAGARAVPAARANGKTW
jgi:hypothetical protein